MRLSELRFLVTRKWIVLTFVILLLIPLFLRLSLWQFHRLEQRRALNAGVSAGLHARPESIATYLESNAKAPTASEWRSVSVTGAFIRGTTVLARTHWRGSSVGLYIVDAFRLNSGTVVPVARGWMDPQTAASTPIVSLAPPMGQVTISGWTRAPESGIAQTGLPPGQIRWINPDSLRLWPPHARRRLTPRLWIQVDMASTQPSQLWSGRTASDGGLLEDAGEGTASPTGVLDLPAPELSEGPHLSYAWQWRAFAVMAVIGWAILVRTEVIRRREQSAPAAERSIEASA